MTKTEITKELEKLIEKYMPCGSAIEREITIAESKRDRMKIEAMKVLLAYKLYD